jgi:hypothetical protein
MRNALSSLLRSVILPMNFSSPSSAMHMALRRTNKPPFSERQHLPAVVLRAKEFSEAVKVEHTGSLGATPRLSCYLWPKTWLIATGDAT